MVDANRIDSLRVDIKYDWCFMVDRIGRGRGLAVFWKNLELVSLLGYSNNHVDMSVVGVDKFKWRFTCFYGFPERHKRRESWNLLRVLSCRSTLPWVCIGDYNDLLWVEDKTRSYPHLNALYWVLEKQLWIVNRGTCP